MWRTQSLISEGVREDRVGEGVREDRLNVDGGGGGSVKAWVGVWREKVKNHVFHVEERIYNL